MAVNDPQAWTLIGAFTALVGVFSAVLFTMLRFSNRTVVAQLEALRAEMQAGFNAVNGRIDAQAERLDGRIDEQGARLDSRIDEQGARLDSRIDEHGARIDVRFDDVDHRLSAIEGDLNLIKGHLIGQRSA